MNPLVLLHLEDLRSGTVFRQYRLLERIGSGGQAFVWSALDERNNHVVALKVNRLEELDPTVISNENQHFERHAQAIAALEHPHILPLFDYGTLGQLRYMAMPYVAAGSLKSLLKTAPLPLPESLRLIFQIVSALDYLHKRQMVHRDLTPANVLVDYSRRAYLADFGLARTLSVTTQALHTGHGTPPYASPEQLVASKLVPQSDLYSLGILFYELITQQLPWGGEKALGIQQLIKADTSLPDPRELNPQVPAGLVEVLRSLTAADPLDRPPNAAAAGQLIREAVGDEQLAAGPEAGAAPSGGRAPAANQGEGAEVLRRGRAAWSTANAVPYPLTLTQFVLADIAYQANADLGQAADADFLRFMLQGALLYSQRLDYWWAQVRDPQEKVITCASVIEADNDQGLQHVVRQLSDDAAASIWVSTLPAAALAPLSGVIGKMEDARLKEKLLNLLGRLVLSPPSWQSAGFTLVDDMELGGLALADQPYAPAAARLIGHLRSEAAVQIILDEEDPNRRRPALMAVREAAGSLPSSVPVLVRAQILAALLLMQLTVDLTALARAYLWGALGGLIGIGAFVYLAFRLPSFLDTTRLLIALERGAFLGLGLGLGVVATRALTLRLTSLPLSQRMAAGVISGGLIIAAGMWGYDQLFLDLLPAGWLIPAGSFIIAAGFALGAGLANQRWLRIGISATGLVLALGLSWGLHVATGMHPLLFYEYGWSAGQVLAMTLVTALPLALLGNGGELAPPNASP